MTKDEVLKNCMKLAYSIMQGSNAPSANAIYNICKEALEHPNQTYKESSLKWEVETLKFESGDYICPSCGNKSLYKTKQSEWCVSHKCLYQHDYPPKEWQGLSDDEIWDIANFLGKNKEWDYPVMFAKTIEMALREKNT